jgi:stage III sporulation protein SpoIIIAA
MEIPDHTPSRALALQSLIGLFSGAADYLLSKSVLIFILSRCAAGHETLLRKIEALTASEGTLSVRHTRESMS